jgi:AbrB family looped-hinge helix DNA binding protein
MSKERVGESRVTTKGQITLPKDVREDLNAEEGDYIIFLKEEGKIFIEAGSLTTKIKKK